MGNPQKVNHRFPTQRSIFRDGPVGRQNEAMLVLVVDEVIGFVKASSRAERRREDSPFRPSGRKVMEWVFSIQTERVVAKGDRVRIGTGAVDRQVQWCAFGRACRRGS